MRRARWSFKVYLTTTVIGLAGLSLSPAAAQAQQVPADEPAEDAGEIIVTGTRIVQTGDAASPVQTVDSAQIAQSGTINVQDLLQENPVFGAPGFSRTNSVFDTQSFAASTVNLRNLGPDRTLTLVNGRRFVAGVPGTSAVDINVIPTLFLDRVDVLTGGASAVYGADAVAGVVNFIYKTKFDGIQVTGQGGVTARSDGGQYQLNALVGRNFADGRGNIMLFGGYSKEEVVFKRDRSTEAGTQGVTSRNGAIAVNSRIAPSLSGANPPGRFFTTNYVFTYDPVTGALRPCSSVNGGTCNLSGTPLAGSALNGQPIGPDGYNQSEVRQIALPVERITLAGRGNYELGGAAKLFVEANYARIRTRRDLDPFPLNESFLGLGTLPIETRVGTTIYRNAFVPDAIFNNAADRDGDGLRDISFSKRLTDFGTRTNRANRELFRIAGGLDGSFGTDERFRYEIYGVYGETTERQNGSGFYNAPNFVQALAAIVDVNDLNGNGNRSEIICANAAARAQGCIPANLYGTGSLAPALPYIAYGPTLRSRITQTVAGGNVSGSLFSLFGADPIGVSAGGEYRRETSSNVFDRLTGLGQSGLGGAAPIPSTAGKFDVYEAYGEAIVPLVSDRPFFHELSVRGAARYSDYSTVGHTFSYNYGGAWAPIRDIQLRAMLARSVRAPNINELFAPNQPGFLQSAIDPCVGVTATSTGNVAQNCRAAPGVNANIAANGAFVSTPLDVTNILTTLGGNPLLREERGDSFTAGVIVNPRSIDALRNLNLSVDYFDIRIKGAIVDTPYQFILNQCYQQTASPLCQFVTRRPTAGGGTSAGSISQIASGKTNSGGVKTSGLDTVLAWRSDSGLIGASGSVNARVAWTHLFNGYRIPLPGSPRDYFANEVGAARDRFTTTLGFETATFAASATGTYVGRSFIDDQISGAKPGSKAAFGVPSEFYLDAQVRFKVGQTFDLYLGADNILDNLPPYLVGVGASPNLDTDGATYDTLGRRYYAGFRVRI